MLIFRVLLMDTCMFSGALPCVDFHPEREGVPHIGTINTSVELCPECAAVGQMITVLWDRGAWRDECGNV